MSSFGTCGASPSSTCRSGLLVATPTPRSTATHTACTNTKGAPFTLHPCARREWLEQPCRPPAPGTYFLQTPERHRTSKPGGRGAAAFRPVFGSDPNHHHFPRNATAQCAARTIFHLPRWLRAKTRQVAGVRGHSKASGIWVCDAYRTVRQSPSSPSWLQAPMGVLGDTAWDNFDASSPYEDGKKDACATAFQSQRPP